jgi:hypothetical protein
LAVHICNPSYSGGRDRKITVQDNIGKKLAKRLSQKSSKAQWCTPVIPATLEEEIDKSVAV